MANNKHDDDSFKPVKVRLVTPKRGRPTKYDPEYCEALKVHMRDGYSFESFAATIGVNRDTLYEWAATHIEFSDAKKDGTELALYFFEKVGMQAMRGELDGFSAGMWIFQMKARFKWVDNHAPDESGEKREFEKAFEEAAKALEERRRALKAA